MNTLVQAICNIISQHNHLLNKTSHKHPLQTNTQVQPNTCKNLIQAQMPTATLHQSTPCNRPANPSKSRENFLSQIPLLGWINTASGSPTTAPLFRLSPVPQPCFSPRQDPGSSPGLLGECPGRVLFLPKSRAGHRPRAWY